MIKANIRLVTIDDVKNFVRSANELECEADLSLEKYVIDAKSIMGVFSLDLSRELQLTVHSDSCEDFLKDIAQYIVK